MSEQNNGNVSALDKFMKDQGQNPSTGAPAFDGGAARKLDLNVAPMAAEAIEPAGFWRRFRATAVDGMILSIGSMPFKMFVAGATILLFGNSDTASAISTVLNIGISLGAFYFYYGYFYSTRGATPGKMLMGIQLIREENGTYLTYRQAFGRELLKSFLGVVTLSISYLMAGIRKDKKGLHDILCQTRVVRIHK